MLWTTRGQFLAALSIIITGVFIFTAMNNAAMNLRTTLEDFYDECNFADLFVSVAGISERDISMLEGEDNIREAEGRLQIDTVALGSDGSKLADMRIITAGADEDRINKLHMITGSRTLGDREIILIRQFAEACGIEAGDTIDLRIKGKKYAFTVVGTAASSEFVYLMESEQTLLPEPESFGIAYVERDSFMRMYGGNTGFNSIVMTLNYGEDEEQVVQRLKDRLDRYGLTRTTKRKDQLSNNMMQTEIDSLAKMSKSLPVVFLTFAGIMLSTMLSRIVRRDRMSIGVLKALGYTSGEVIVHYLKYAAIAGVAGGIIGTAIGTALSGWMTMFYLEYFSIPMLSVRIYYGMSAASVVLSCTFCVASGYIGVRSIVNINPAESMKPEAPKSGGRILLERIKPLWRRLSFSWKIVARNCFREKRRVLFVGAASAIACGMMIMTFWMKDICDIIFFKHYGEFLRMDYSISFDSFAGERIIDEIIKETGSHRIEGKTEFPFELEKGRNSKVVNVIGFKNSFGFYDLRDENGNSQAIPDTGMLISSNLAKSLGVSTGDKIYVKNLLPEKNDMFVDVKGIVKQSLGINAYMDIDYLNENFIEKGTLNGALADMSVEMSERMTDMERISSVQSQSDMRDMFMEFMGLVNAMIAVIIVFSGMLGFVIVYSMTVMSINERTGELSSLRVMGFTKGEIFRLLMRENMVVSFIGVLFGIPVGIWLVDYVGALFTTDMYTMSEPVNAVSIVMAVIMTMSFLAMSQAACYVKIHRLDFMQSLKSRIT